MGKYEWSENYLLSQGYSKQEINRYFHIDSDVITDIMNDLLHNMGHSASRDRKCLTLFGQPGCGKSTYMKNNHIDNYVVIDIDDLRKLYPHREALIKVINHNHNTNDNIPLENTMGRDYTNFTRKFVGVLTDNLLNECIKQGYNIAWQKHASDYKALEDIFKHLRNNHYTIDMVLVLVDADVSWRRCQNRNQLNDMVMNTVSKDFHDSYVAKIPQAIVDIIAHYIVADSYVSKLEIVDMDGSIMTIDRSTNLDYDRIRNYVKTTLNLQIKNNN